MDQNDLFMPVAPKNEYYENEYWSYLWDQNTFGEKI